MKTITKILLPLSTMIATTSMVTPLVACRNDNDQWKNAVNLMKYTPDPDSICKEDALTEPKATDALFNQENSINLIKQDIYTYLAWEFKNELPGVLWLLGIYWAGEAKKVVGSLSDVNLKYDENKHVANLTGTIRLKAVCDMLNTSGEKIGTYSIETQHKIKNVPYHIVRSTHPLDPDTEYWTSYFSASDLAGKDWYVDRSFTGKAVYDDKQIPDEHESSSIRFSYLNIKKEGYYEELTMIRWWSYYLSEVEKE